MTATEHTTTDAELITLLRKRLHDVEKAAETYLEVVESTGAERMKAYADLRTALTTDFRTALLCSSDTTDEQRTYWLNEIEKDAAALASASPADRAGGRDG